MIFPYTGGPRIREIARRQTQSRPSACHGALYVGPVAKERPKARATAARAGSKTPEVLTLAACHSGVPAAKSGRQRRNCASGARRRSKTSRPRSRRRTELDPEDRRGSRGNARPHREDRTQPEGLLQRDPGGLLQLAPRVTRRGAPLPGTRRACDSIHNVGRTRGRPGGRAPGVKVTAARTELQRPRLPRSRIFRLKTLFTM